MQMANDLCYGTHEQILSTGKFLDNSNIDELINILEVSREVIFENSGDDKLYFATNYLVDFIQMVLFMRSLKIRS